MADQPVADDPAEDRTSDPRKSPAMHRDGRAAPALGAWVLACVLGEAVGLTASGMVGAVLVPLLAEGPAGGGTLVLEAMMVLAGALEGTCVGVAQWLVLRRRLPIAPGRWVAATAGGFATGWLAGGLIATLEPQMAAPPGPSTVIIVGAFSGLCLGAVVGLLQALVLRGLARPVLPWMLANAAAWASGMVVAYVGASSLGPGAYTLGHLGLAAVTGGLVGLVVGLITSTAGRLLKTA